VNGRAQVNYIIRSLEHIAEHLPTNMQEWSAIPDIPQPQKAEIYGPRFVAAINEFIKENPEMLRLHPKFQKQQKPQAPPAAAPVKRALSSSGMGAARPGQGYPQPMPPNNNRGPSPGIGGGASKVQGTSPSVRALKQFAYNGSGGSSK
jgi:hypothetical protein